ncbi:MAG: homocysteine S-methyltransferase family protein [Chloroflexota bacterium]
MMTFDKSIYLLDGGMGQELIKRGVRGNEALWSANALITDPDVVQAIHESYIEAGADVITTNTYCTTRARFDRYNLSERFVELNQLACRLAQQAREEQERADVLIAGSLPPYYGSYRPELARSYEELTPIYQEQAEVLAPHVDFFICETMSTAEEARAAASAAASTEKPVWVAWTLEDGGADHLRSGETLQQAFEALIDLPIDAFLVNCCAPESITAAMPKLASLGSQPVGGYANGFVAIPKDWLIESSVDVLGSRTDLDPESYAGYGKEWLEAGARIVGGCCEVGPQHIARLRRLIDTEL